ncbi:hypothetical protein MPSEU_000272700 [Mayamaea pseudoterrestris]|nr:hypothetical protein MPSEU_000272700 [Mayamaea pseudoterrestris]
MSHSRNEFPHDLSETNYHGSAAGSPQQAHNSFVNHEEYSANNTMMRGYGRPTTQLRKRNMEAYYGYSGGSNNNDGGNGYGKTNGRIAPSPNVVKKLDFLFPKVDQEYTMTTEGGGFMSLIAYVLIFVFLMAEIVHWRYANGTTLEHIRVDTSLGKRMRVNLNITFPGLACEDLHVDVMDVAGDSQLNIDDTLRKVRLKRGIPIGNGEMVESNKHKKEQAVKDRVLNAELPENYCGPCFGAQESETECCNSCDELLEAYAKKRWRTDIIELTAEQCIREGRDKKTPKRMKHGEGCNLSGHMVINRVAGNFHIAMGEGLERDGRHIHSFVPDDTPNFNASHIIHHLSFGLPESQGESSEQATMDGIIKLVSKQTGTTGLFQYFIKVVPTTYLGKGENGGPLETNRYFFTERFRPLNKDWYDDDDHFQEEIQDDDVANADPGGLLPKQGSVSAHVKQGAGQHAHHHVRNSILPGIFFIYEIYPFSVEVEPVRVPLTHLLIRLMAIVGGIWTCTKWVDSLVSKSSRSDKRQRSSTGRTLR